MEADHRRCSLRGTRLSVAIYQKLFENKQNQSVRVNLTKTRPENARVTAGDG